MGRIQRKGTLGTKSKSNKSKSIQKTRKQLRKEKRQQKKISRATYYQRNKSKNQLEKTSKNHLEKTSKNDGDESKIKTNGDINQVSSTKTQKRRRPKDMKEEKIQKNVKKQRMVQLKQANLDEDRTIKQLEKQLKLNKRKSKSIPKSFVSDGLDCILYNLYVTKNFLIRVLKFFFYSIWN